MNAEILHIFDTYSKGLLSESERQAFEQRLQQEPDLKEEFDEYLHIINGVNAYERERLKTLLKDRSSRPRYNISWISFKHVAAAAAIILIIMVPGYFFFRSTTYPQRLVKEFYIPEPGLPVAMGASMNPMLDQAMIEYKDGQYEESLLKLKQLLAVSPENDTLNYYAGICYFETLKNKDAIARFQKVSNPGSPYYFMARYNEGLSLLRDGQKEAARTVLKVVVDGDSGILKDKAELLLGKF